MFKNFANEKCWNRRSTHCGCERNSCKDLGFGQGCVESMVDYDQMQKSFVWDPMVLFQSDPYIPSFLSHSTRCINQDY